MIFNPGAAEEYKRRHDAIWPELAALLRRADVSDYSIRLEEETHHLFAVLKRREDNSMQKLASDPIVRRWWDVMAYIMATHPNSEPFQALLVKMFHLERAGWAAPSDHSGATIFSVIRRLESTPTASYANCSRPRR